SFRHVAMPRPPCSEICHGPPLLAPGLNGRTYTSFFPESFETYAIKRPSGDSLSGCTCFGLRKISVIFGGLDPSSSKDDTMLPPRSPSPRLTGRPSAEQ